MNFQPKFDSNTLRAEAVRAEPPLAPKPEPELSQKADPRHANGLIMRLSVVGFIAALASRATDPIIPPIAHDIQVDPNAVALLTTAFALPFALVQPVLGPVGDMIGKVRVSSHDAPSAMAVATMNMPVATKIGPPNSASAGNF